MAQLSLSRGEAACHVIEFCSAAGGPEQYRYQAVDQYPKTGLLGSQYCSLERIDRICTGPHTDDHADEAADMPEILLFRSAHHVGAKTDIGGQEDHKQPTLLGKERNQCERGYGAH